LIVRLLLMFHHFHKVVQVPSLPQVTEQGDQDCQEFHLQSMGNSVGPEQLVNLLESPEPRPIYIIYEHMLLSLVCCVYHLKMLT
jgi:hypothetical protein